MSKQTKSNYGINCPNPACRVEAPDGEFEYREKPISTQRIVFDTDASSGEDLPTISLLSSEYEHNDAENPVIVCRSCWKAFPVPQAFYDADPWS